MDALARLLGDERREVGSGLYVKRVPAGCYLAALRARSAADNEQAGNMAFTAELLSWSLCDGEGARVLATAQDALDRLPIEFFVSAGIAAGDLNRLEAEDGVAGKSESAP